MSVANSLLDRRRRQGAFRTVVTVTKSMNTQHAFRARVTDVQLRSAYRSLASLSNMLAPERMNLPGVLDLMEISDFLPPDLHFWRFASIENEIHVNWTECFSVEGVRAALQPPAPEVASHFPESVVSQMRQIWLIGVPLGSSLRSRNHGGVVTILGRDSEIRQDLRMRVAKEHLRILRLEHRFYPEWALVNSEIQVVYRDKVTGQMCNFSRCYNSCEEALQVATSWNAFF